MSVFSSTNVAKATGFGFFSISKISIIAGLSAGLIGTISLGCSNFALAQDTPAPTSSASPVASSGSSGVAAFTPDEEQYFTIQSVSIEEVPDSISGHDLEGLVPPPVGINPPVGVNPPVTIPGTGAGAGSAASGIGKVVGEIGQIDGAIGSIVNTGKLIWSIIEANKAVVNVSTDVANAIPQASTTWDSLGGWSAPETRLFHITYQNKLGSNVIDFTYRVIYLYGGNVNGKGQFLNGVSIVPADLSVAWGYTFTAKANVPSVTNAGTSADPIAAMQLQMQWSVSTMISNNERTQNYYIRGDGQFSELK